MNSQDIRNRFLAFFEKRGHTIIPSASLVPENDPSSLFITAGMQPLVPYLLGAKHPAGTRLVDVQKCIRTGDIDDVGDNRHLTFFEMLGNWSLGDYFKKEAIKYSMEFLTSKEEGLGLDPKRLFVTTFRGEDGIPRDEDSIKYWIENFKKHGIDAKIAGVDEKILDDVRIIPLGKEDNFWIAGTTGPCGGDTEMFYDVVGNGKVEGNFQELVKSGRIIEIWNDVFMEFNKTSDGKYEKLEKPNVDTGMGLERTTVVMQGKNNVYETDIFEPLISYIKSHSKEYDEKSARIVADHIRAAVFIISDGVRPSNNEAGYVLRRIIRRAVRHSDVLELETGLMSWGLVNIIIDSYKNIYQNIDSDMVRMVIYNEEEKFRKTLAEGLKQLENIAYKIENGNLVNPIKRKELSGLDAFNLYQTYGFPIEITLEICEEKGIEVDLESFHEEFKKHQEISRVGSEQKFKGGLADTSEMSVKYHTATHMLNQALRVVLGEHVYQRGSNITTERLRFDFSHDKKMTDEEKKAVEALVNEKIAEALPVTYEDLPFDEAKLRGAIGVFGEKYGDVVRVYQIGNKEDWFSLEFCGGPHVKNTSELGHFRILKEEAVAQGIRRIKAVLG